MNSFWEQGHGWGCYWDWSPLVNAAAFPSLPSLVPSTDWLSHSVLLDTEDVIAFPVHQHQAFWGRAAWGKVDVGTLCGTCAQFSRGDKQHSFCLESISSK